MSPHTVRRRQRYQKRGVLGMVDGRHAPRRPVLGQVDPRVVEVLRRLMDQAVDGSTHTVSYYFTRVGQAVKQLEGAGVEMPSRATFYRLFNRLDNGVVDRVELVGMVDVATRSITAAVLRPTTKSVDAALLLARSVTPAPMRPGWPEALRMEHSALPFERSCRWTSGCGMRPRSR